jgi:hypothetical protein
MNRPRIYADFHNLDDVNRVRLTCSGTQRDLDRQGVQLRDGLQLTLYTDDEDDDGRPDPLLADATVWFDRNQECWVAEVDWSALHHDSETVAQRAEQ